ncbi:MAG: aspartate/glutamate racemase family protein, partial [Clostridia bacterium]|nr:aspartate/glutamate racemase family protein [Clostridia bacterium]
MDRIGVYDSGIGGLTTLGEIIKNLGGGNYVYLADNANAPFGCKEPEELYSIGRLGVSELIKLGCNYVVLGCNTMTTIKPLLEKAFPSIRFIGIEPAVLPAVRECCRVAVLATPTTISSEKVQRLVEPYKARVTCYPNSNLAGIIERLAPDFSTMDRYVEKTCGYLKDYDAVVLGCTHFVYLRETISKVFPHIKIYDGNEGVGKRVKELVGIGKGEEKVKIFTTDRGEENRY